MTGSENPFDRFSAKLYLQEYYGDIGKENQFLLDFLHETYSAWSPESIWDIGGGPTIYQLISASRKARRIRIFEYLDENRSAVELWRSGKPGGFDWSTYFAAVGSREGLGADEIESRLKDRIQSVEAIDLFSGQPSLLKKNQDWPPNAISSHFCVESITSDPSLFETAWENLTSLVAPGAYLIMSLLKNARQYSAGPHYFPAFPIEEIGLQIRLKRGGFQEIELSTVPAEHGRDYEGIICVRAIRQI